jgi:glycosyltransferase involved in cell wall biosynthesis
MAAMLRGLRREGWTPDVIHAHVFEAGVPAVLLGRLLRRPVVVSEHFTAFQRGLVQGADRRLARAVFGHADLVCPVSEDLRRQLAAIQPRGRYRVVPNVVDTAVFRPPERPADGNSGRGARLRGHMAAPPPSNGRRLLNVASLDVKKGHDVLLDAVARLRASGRAVELDVVGEGELRGALEARSRELGLGEAVRFLGARPPGEVAGLMREADAFVLPSRFENLPVVLLEAMASGLPAVATDVGGVAEVVDERAGALVPPDVAERLTVAIADVLDRRASFAPQALHDLAAARYGLEAVGDLWDGVYREVVDARVSRRRGAAGP